MKHFLAGPLPDQARTLMRRVGYGEHRGYGDQISYTRRHSVDAYPRYHVYVEDRDGGMQINLHLDQKKASYEGTSAHAGEYEGPLVEAEMHRIVTEILSLTGMAGIERNSGGSPTRKGAPPDSLRTSQPPPTPPPSTGGGKFW